MCDRLHQDETPVDEGVVRSLLASAPAGSVADELESVPPSGTDNTLWRLRRASGPDLVARLPRTPAAARSLIDELEVLDQLANRPLPFAVPVVRHRGDPTERFPHPWAVLEWIDGADAWRGREAFDDDDEHLAGALAHVVMAIGSLAGMRAPPRDPGRRGGPLSSLLDNLDRWLDDPIWSADAHLDVPAVRRLADEAREVADGEVAPAFVHGDLLPGNLIVEAGRPIAVIDWGSAAIADPAQDLTPAWAVLGRRGRRAFRRAVGADDAAWLRGRTFELEHAVGAIVYYRPRRHPLADVMSRTLERILADAAEPTK